jgi:hypothetical protein
MIATMMAISKKRGCTSQSAFIYAFNSSEQRNVEIMAANRANFCTYYVCNDKEISQPVIFKTKIFKI